MQNKLLNARCSFFCCCDPLAWRFSFFSFRLLSLFSCAIWFDFHLVVSVRRFAPCIRFDGISPATQTLCARRVFLYYFIWLFCSFLSRIDKQSFRNYFARTAHTHTHTDIAFRIGAFAIRTPVHLRKIYLDATITPNILGPCTDTVGYGSVVSVRWPKSRPIISSSVRSHSTLWSFPASPLPRTISTYVRANVLGNRRCRLAVARRRQRHAIHTARNFTHFR